MASQRSVEAEAILLRALERFPRGPQADECLLQLAIRSYQQQDYSGALERLNRLSEQSPDSTCGDRASYWRGAALLGRGEYAQAAEVLEPLVEPQRASPPEDVEVAVDASSAYLLSFAYLATDRPADALCVLQLPRSDRRTAEVDARLALLQAIALGELGRSDEAISPLRAALAEVQRGPTAARCRVKLIECLLAAGQPEQAAEIYSEWAGEPLGSVARAEAAGRLAEAAYARGEYERAAELYTTLADSPVSTADRAHGLCGLAWSRYQLGDTAAAEARFAELAQRYPQDPRVPKAELARAELLERRGQLDDAAQTYSRLIDTAPTAHVVSLARLKGRDCCSSRRIGGGVDATGTVAPGRSWIRMPSTSPLRPWLDPPSAR